MSFQYILLHCDYLLSRNRSSGGATPHSGTPGGRGMRLLSQSTSLSRAAFNFCPGRSQWVILNDKHKDTNEVLLPDVELLSVFLQTQSFLLGELFEG